MVLWFQDLATALLAVLGNEKASREIINISGEKYVTFDGLARACAKVHLIVVFLRWDIHTLSLFGSLLDVNLWCYQLIQAGGFPEPEIVHYNPKEFDFGKTKAFPFRDQVNF